MELFTNFLATLTVIILFLAAYGAALDYQIYKAEERKKKNLEAFYQGHTNETND